MITAILLIPNFIQLLSFQINKQNIFYLEQAVHQYKSTVFGIQIYIFPSFNNNSQLLASKVKVSEVII